MSRQPQTKKGRGGDPPPATFHRLAERFAEVSRSLTYSPATSYPELREVYATLKRIGEDGLTLFNRRVEAEAPGFGPAAKSWLEVERWVSRRWPERIPRLGHVLSPEAEDDPGDPRPYIENSIAVCKVLGERAGERAEKERAGYLAAFNAETPIDRLPLDGLDEDILREFEGGSFGVSKLGVNTLARKLNLRRQLVSEKCRWFEHLGLISRPRPKKPYSATKRGLDWLRLSRTPKPPRSVASPSPSLRPVRTALEQGHAEPQGTGAAVGGRETP